MIQIEDAIVSMDVIEKEFSCDVLACKGACCVVGDSGAPLEPEEILAIENAMPSIRNYLSEKSLHVIEKYGVANIDSDGDLVTSLINQNECVFVTFSETIAECAIEKSWKKGKCSIQKPISCHLYPIRLTKYNSFTAVNYHSWEICDPAIKNGKLQQKHVYEFTKAALIRKFGKEWYKQLCIAAEYVLHKNETSEKKN